MKNIIPNIKKPFFTSFSYVNSLVYDLSTFNNNKSFEIVRTSASFTNLFYSDDIFKSTKKYWFYFTITKTPSAFSSIGLTQFINTGTDQTNHHRIMLYKSGSNWSVIALVGNTNVFTLRSFTSEPTQSDINMLNLVFFLNNGTTSVYYTVNNVRYNYQFTSVFTNDVRITSSSSASNYSVCTISKIHQL